MSELKDAALSKEVFEHEVKVLKLTTGEEIISKVRTLGIKYELIEPVQFRWGFEYDSDSGHNVERLQPTSFPTNANLGRYEIEKKFVMVIGSPRPDAIGVYHSFVASVLNYVGGDRIKIDTGA